MVEKNNTLVDIPPNRKVIVVYDGSINKNNSITGRSHKKEK